MEPDTSEEFKNTSKSVSQLWSRFEDAADRKDYFRNWLGLQSQLIPNTVQSLLVMSEREQKSFVPVSKWPEGETDVERLAEISERVIEQQCGLLTELPMPSGERPSSLLHYGVAYPVMIDGQIHGVVAIEVTARAESEIRSVMEQLQWGVAWMELFFRRQRASEDGAALTRLKSAVDLLAGVLSQDHFKSACMTFVTELASHLSCDRVSLGFMRKNHVHVQSISHSAQFGKHMNLIKAISKAMDESIIQRREILYPLTAEAEVLVTRDHRELAKLYGEESIITIPLYVNGHYYGALTLERPSEEPFSKDDVEFCRSISALAAPALESKRLNDRLLIFKISDSIGRQIIRLVGPRYAGRKLAAILITALLVFFSIATGEYRLSADTALEGTVRRVAVAPFNGYIKEAYVRAGDVVKNEMLMCTLDDRDLRLERLNWMSQRTQFQRQYQEALAKHERAQVKIMDAKLDQAAAQLNLVESKLERTLIRAPFDGIVISGDLSQRLGGLVEQGEVLFEVTPLDSYRVILKVDERRIADVRKGQHGNLLLSSIPDEQFDFIIEKITPITTPEEGRNYFRVEAQLQNVTQRLRPGMEGIGKISVDRRKLISIWTRSLVEWTRLWIWSWWP